MVAGTRDEFRGAASHAALYALVAFYSEMITSEDWKMICHFWLMNRVNARARARAATGTVDVCAVNEEFYLPSERQSY